MNMYAKVYKLMTQLSREIKRLESQIDDRKYRLDTDKCYLEYMRMRLKQLEAEK